MPLSRLNQDFAPGGGDGVAIDLGVDDVVAVVEDSCGGLCAEGVLDERWEAHIRGGDDFAWFAIQIDLSGDAVLEGSVDAEDDEAVAPLGAAADVQPERLPEREFAREAVALLDALRAESGEG